MPGLLVCCFLTYNMCASNRSNTNSNLNKPLVLLAGMSHTFYCTLDFTIQHYKYLITRINYLIVFYFVYILFCVCIHPTTTTGFKVRNTRDLSMLLLCYVLLPAPACLSPPPIIKYTCMHEPIPTDSRSSK